MQGLNPKRSLNFNIVQSGVDGARRLFSIDGSVSDKFQEDN